MQITADISKILKTVQRELVQRVQLSLALLLMNSQNQLLVLSHFWFPVL